MNSIVIERMINASPERVWAMWTEPKYLAQWFGAPGHSIEDSISIELHPGGEWKATMDVEGGEYPFVGKVLEVETNRRMVFVLENVEDRSDPNSETLTVELSPDGNRTLMYFKQEGHLPVEEYEVGLAKGYAGFFDKLQDIAESL